MRSSHRAVVVVCVRCLRAQYPMSMYDPKAWGMAHIMAGVRPPSARFMAVADLAVVSALFALIAGDNVPPHLLLGHVGSGRTGILPLGRDVPTAFMVNYDRQLNPHTLRSARCGMQWASWWLSPHMP